MKNFKNIIILAFLLFTTGAFYLSPILLNTVQTNNLLLIIVSTLFTIIFLLIIDISKIKLKDLLHFKLLKYLLIIYLSILIISHLTIVTLLINNFYYITTPLSIISGIILFFSLILSLNKKNVNLNIFLIFFFISFLLIFFYIFLFPKSLIKITYFNASLIKNNIIIYFSYLIILFDLIFYKLFICNDNKTNNKTYLISLIISMIILLYFTFKDLTITDLQFLHPYFPNILKYQIINKIPSIHFDFIIIIWALISFVFKIIMYTEGIRICCLKKKNHKNNVIVYLILFLIANTIANQVAMDGKYLIFQLKIVILFTILIILLIGGLYVIKRIHRKK